MLAPFKLAAVGAVALVTLAGLATPASASEITPIAPPVPANPIVSGSTYSGVLLNGLTVVFDCTATAVGAAVSVNIQHCQPTTGGTNKPLALPGNTATTGGTATLPLRDFQVCYDGIVTYLGGTTKPFSGCSALIPSVGGVPNLVGGGVAVQ
jgi:hypothetical protein